MNSFFCLTSSSKVFKPLDDDIFHLISNYVYKYVLTLSRFNSIDTSHRKLESKKLHMQYVILLFMPEINEILFCCQMKSVALQETTFGWLLFNLLPVISKFVINNQSDCCLDDDVKNMAYEGIATYFLRIPGQCYHSFSTIQVDIWDNVVQAPVKKRSANEYDIPLGKYLCIACYGKFRCEVFKWWK